MFGPTLPENLGVSSRRIRSKEPTRPKGSGSTSQLRQQPPAPASMFVNRCLPGCFALACQSLHRATAHGPLQLPGLDSAGKSRISVDKLQCPDRETTLLSERESQAYQSVLGNRSHGPGRGLWPVLSDPK